MGKKLHLPKKSSKPKKNSPSRTAAFRSMYNQKPELDIDELSNIHDFDDE